MLDIGSEENVFGLRCFFFLEQLGPGIGFTQGKLARPLIRRQDSFIFEDGFC